MAEIRWHGAEFEKRLHAEMAKRLKVCAERVRSRVVRLLSVSVRRVPDDEDITIVERFAFGRFRVASGRTGQERVSGKKKKKKYKVYRSKPGEPPRADTGTLRKSIFWALDESNLVAIVGTPLKYGKYLEIGTSKMAPRPYLRRGLVEMADPIKKILTRPLPKIG